MFRPERMTSTSIILLKKDLDTVLEALSEFGEFHIEPSVETVAPAEFNQHIQQIEESLADVNDLISRFNLEKSNFVDMFRASHPAKIQVTVENWQQLTESISQAISELKKQTLGLQASLSALREKTANLTHTKNMLATMQEMGVDVGALELRLIYAAVVAVPKKNFNGLTNALAGFPLLLNCCHLTKTAKFTCLATPSKYKSNVEKIIKTYQGEIFQIPPDLPSDLPRAIAQIDSQLKENLQKEKATEASLEKLGQENRDTIISLRETSQNILTLLLAKRKTLQSGRLAAVKGFVPTKQFYRLQEKVNLTLKGNALVISNEIAASEDPPTLIRHNRFVRPFEELTTLYGIPRYDELDPTPILAVTFPLIFGLMFGDVGHGFFLLIGGITLGFMVKNQQSFKNMCWILAACGIGAIFAGILFGEFFGMQLFAPLWFSPFDNVLQFLIFSLFVGVAQIISGLVLEAVNYALKRDMVDVLLTSVPKVAFYVGSVYLIAIYKLNFGVWFSGPILFALIPFLILVFAKPILFQAKHAWSAVQVPKNTVPLGERFFESSDLVARLLSNTMSYTRILALLMAHWALILVTTVIAGLVGSASILGLVFSGIVIVGGNLFVIALEGLIVFIHSLRLHFYEWFSRFYQGDGTPFSPLRQSAVYTEVILKKKS